MLNQNLQLEQSLLLDAQNDSNKFNDIYKYFVNDVYRFSYSILNNQHDAEDITSQTFLTFYNKIKELEWKGISLKYWLFTVARNLSYSKLRKPFELDLDENIKVDNETEVSFVDEIMNKDLVDRIKKEIQKLSPIDQEIINLRIWEGLQFEEIAKMQDAKLSTVKLRFYRAIEKLKTSIEDKKYMRAISLPILFTGIKEVSTLPAYNASSGLMSASLAILQQTNMTATNLTTTKQFLASKAGIAIVAGVTVVTTICGYAVYLNTRPSQNNIEESFTLTPTPSTTIIEANEVENPSITATQITSDTKLIVGNTTCGGNKTNYQISVPNAWESEDTQYSTLIRENTNTNGEISICEISYNKNTLDLKGYSYGGYGEASGVSGDKIKITETVINGKTAYIREYIYQTVGSQTVKQNTIEYLFVENNKEWSIIGSMDINKSQAEKDNFFSKLEDIVLSFKSLN